MIIDIILVLIITFLLPPAIFGIDEMVRIYRREKNVSRSFFNSNAE